MQKSIRPTNTDKKLQIALMKKHCLAIVILGFGFPI